MPSKKVEKLYCVHGHKIDSHPNCFSRFWYDAPEQRIGYLDIESSGLDADNDKMLSWCIKPRRESRIRYDTVEFNDIFDEPGKVNREYDKPIVKKLLEEMKEYTGLVTYYGTGFDIPFIRSRAMALGLEFPGYGKIAHIDLYYHVRSKMKLSHSSLSAATKHLDIAGKTHLDFKYWKLAALGDKESMRELLHHNQQDVVILEKLHNELEPFGRFDRKTL